MCFTDNVLLGSSDTRARANHPTATMFVFIVRNGRFALPTLGRRKTLSFLNAQQRTHAACSEHAYVVILMCNYLFFVPRLMNVVWFRHISGVCRMDCCTCKSHISPWWIRSGACDQNEPPAMTECNHFNWIRDTIGCTFPSPPALLSLSLPVAETIRPSNKCNFQIMFSLNWSEV